MRDSKHSVLSGAGMAAAAATAEVAVVGGGIAGLVCAVRCAELGRRVVVFERQTEDRYPCNSRITGGVFHCGLHDVRTDPDELVARLGIGLEEPSRLSLLRVVADGARGAVEWLQAQGARFVRGGADPWHSFVLAPPAIAQLGRHWEGRGGDVLLRLLETRLTAAGGRLLRGHDAGELIVEDGVCAGVRGVTSAGEGFECRARAVVLADGGFQANRAQIRAAGVTADPDRIVQRNAGTGIGAGFAMAERAGARLMRQPAFYGHVQSRDALVNPDLWPYPWLDELLKHYVVVDASGRRFTDEGRGGICVANAIAALADPAGATLICDEAGWNGPGQARFLPPNPNLEKAGGTVWHAASVAAIAGMAGLDAASLTATLDSWNAAVRSRQLERLDPARSERKGEALPIATGSLIAIPLAAGITYTMAGVLIDDQGRAQREAGGPFAGLYAAGSTSAGLEGGDDVLYVGGLVKAATTALRVAACIGAS